MTSTFRDVAFPFRTIPTVAVLAWIATRADDPTVATYVVVGVGLMTTSDQSLFQMGWVLSSEIFQGTMQHTLIARTPLVLVILGKVLAVTAVAAVSGLISLAVAWWVARDLIEVGSPVLLLVSVLFAVPAIVATGFIWAPLFVLVGTRPGFVNAILPFATVFGGSSRPSACCLARPRPRRWRGRCRRRGRRTQSSTPSPTAATSGPASR